MAEKTNVPEIRFAGFTDPWEQRKLGDVATRYDNLRIPITAKDRIPGDTPYYGANGIQDYVEGYTHEGEFVLVAEDGATDLDNYPVQLISGLSWVNNHAHVIKAIPDLAQNRFIMHLIKSMDIASYLVGGTRSKLNAEVLMGIELKLPSNSEQIYIGTLLSTLDSLITLHQRKYDKLCAVKKSMLDKMFPKPGEIEPEIRFAGFTDPWEQRKLGELFTESNERSSSEEILSVSVANGIYPASESGRDTNPGASIANYKVVRVGDIVYNSMRMWQGAVDSSKYNGIVSPAYVVARPAVELDSICFGYLLKRTDMLYKYLCDSQGNSKDTQTLRYDRFAEIVAKVPPTIDEQRAIADCLKGLDILITLHQREPPHMMKEGKNANQYQRRIPFL